MSCKYHTNSETVSRCKICNAELCEECNDFQNDYGGCPVCCKIQIERNYVNLKGNLMYNIISIVCAIAFLSLYIVCVSLSKLNTTLIIFGAIILGVLLPISITTLVYTLFRIKKTKQLRSKY